MRKDRRPAYPAVDKALYNWFRTKRNLNVPLDGNLLRAKALEFATALEIPGFKASNGWFERWKSRYDIKFGKISGESESADLGAGADWLKDKWPKIKQNYKPEDIFNADETALFFKMTPGKTFRLKSDSGHGTKQKKDRVTLMVCASMTGEKRKLLLIGKSKNPRYVQLMIIYRVTFIRYNLRKNYIILKNCLHRFRCFPKNQKVLPVSYAYNKKAWMTGTLFESWIRDWNDELRRSNRKILLLLDNCSAHVEISNLSNICIEYFPPNLTSVMQPMDQGIILNLKTFYRRFMIEKILSHLELKNELLSIDLLQAVDLISMAWNSVTSSTISNCFRHAKLYHEEEEVIEISVDAEFLAENAALFDEFIEAFDVEPGDELTMESYVGVDNDVRIFSVRYNLIYLNYKSILKLLLG